MFILNRSGHVRQIKLRGKLYRVSPGKGFDYGLALRPHERKTLRYLGFIINKESDTDLTDKRVDELDNTKIVLNVPEKSPVINRLLVSIKRLFLWHR